MSNLPLPDQLNAIREQIKALRSKEEELRSALLSHPELRTGTDWLVEIKETTRQQLDQKELRAMYPAEAEEHTHPFTVVTLELRGITADGEIVPARRFRAAQEAAQ